MCLVSTKAPSKPHSIRIVLNSLKWDYTYAYTRKGRLAPSPSYPIVYLYYYNMCIQSGNDLTEDLSYRIIPLFHVDNTWKGFRDQVALRYTLDLTRRQFHNPFPTTSQLELEKILYSREHKHFIHSRHRNIRGKELKWRIACDASLFF